MPESHAAKFGATASSLDFLIGDDGIFMRVLNSLLQDQTALYSWIPVVSAE